MLYSKQNTWQEKSEQTLWIGGAVVDVIVCNNLKWIFKHDVIKDVKTYVVFVFFYRME
jgi:hypothetical protein